MNSGGLTASEAVRLPKPRVLVLDGHSRAAVEVLQSLGRHGIAVDIAAEQQDCVAFHSRYALRKLRQPPSHDVGRLTTWIRELDAENGYWLVVPATEFSLLAFQEVHDSDPLRIKAVLPRSPSLRTALDKRRTYELAQELGILHPRTRIVCAGDESPDSLRFPVVLKPSQSTAVIDDAIATVPPIIVRDVLGRKQAIERLKFASEILEQEYVEGSGVGVEMLFQDGKKVWYFVHHRVHEYPLTGGASTYRRSAAPHATLVGIAERLLQRLHWHGVAMVEFRITPNGEPYLMEINPRLWGSLALAIDAGVDFPWGLFQIASGESLNGQPQYRVGYYSRALAEDVQWQVANLRADHKDVSLLTKPRVTALLGMLRPLIGGESWDHFDWRDLGPTAFVLRSLFSRYKTAIGRKMTAIALRKQLMRRHHQVLKEISGNGHRCHTLLFLCYGNICRSPVAQELARRMFSNVQIESAGFHQREGRCCPDNIRRAAGDLGLEMSSFCSKRIGRAQLSKADLILVMDTQNYLQLQLEYPDAAKKTMFLGMFASSPALNITDPYGKSEEETAEVLSRIESAIMGLRQQLFPASQAASN